MVVFVDVEKEESQQEGGGPSNRTRANLKKKADQALVNIHEIKKYAINMNKLE